MKVRLIRQLVMIGRKSRRDQMCVGRYAAKVMAQWKITGAMIKLLPNCEWNQKQKHKKQPWGNVECFAFGGATVRFASLETSFHAANHTIPPPPSYEGLPLCPKDKNRSPFHGEKPLKIVICFYEAMSKRQTKGTVLLVCQKCMFYVSVPPVFIQRI